MPRFTNHNAVRPAPVAPVPVAEADAADDTDQAAVFGPYTERSPKSLRASYRVVVQNAGERRSRKFASWGEAQRYAAAQRAALVDAPRTIGQALALWLATKDRADAWSDRTWDRTFKDVSEFATPETTPLRAVDAEFVRGYVDRISARLALASCRSRYAAVVGFLEWCRRRGHLLRNPAHDLESDELPWRTKRGRRLVGRGKQQLRGEAEALAYLAQARLYPTAEERVAAVLPLLHGLASGEVLHLRVRDVELEGGRLWISDDGEHVDNWHPKTRSRVSHVDIDDPDLRRDLAHLVDSRSRDTDYLFASRRNPGAPYGEDWLWRRVRWCCEGAEVTVVCPHGLRGTYATLLRVLAAQRAPDIARLLRHGDSGQTAKKAYIGAPEARLPLRMVRGAA